MLRNTVLVRALQVAFATGAITVAAMPAAMAQSHAAGSVYGTVAAGSGDTVVLKNNDTNQTRTGTLDASGSFRVTNLPVGTYTATLMKGGAAVGTTQLDVVAGQGAEAQFAPAAAVAANGAGVQSVRVTGRRSRIDVSNTTNSAVFTAKELAKLPVQQNLTSIVLLAPNTTKGDSAFGNTTSIGGGGASENSFYLNGFPITNPLSQLGGMELPFGAIQQASVLTGGFGAEFGRSIGGVLNVTSKSGTNKWEAGATYSITPDSLRASQKNIYYPNTGDANNVSTDGKLDLRRDNRELSSRQYGVYVGGPIVQDKLFMFVAADRTTTDDGYVASTTQTNATTIGQQGWNQNRSGENRWLAKIDWNITDEHRLEFTSAGDDFKTTYEKYGYALNPNNPNARATLDGNRTNNLYTSATAHNLGPTDPAYPGTPGAKLNSLRYIGNVTEDLTVTALYGIMKTERGTVYNLAGANTVSGVLPPTIGTTAAVNQWPALNSGLYRNYNVFPGSRSNPGDDEVKAGRLDLEYKLGKHTLRAGIDQSKLESSTAGYATSGGSQWTYRYVGAGNANVSSPMSNGRTAIVSNFGGSGVDGYYARQIIFSSVTAASSKQSAQYIEDRYQATKDLLIVAGLRNDSYSNSNGDGEKFIDMKRQIAPRLSASWDVNGDNSFKVYGSLGRYYLQLPTQVAARAASRSTYTTQDVTYTGIDPTTGVPTGINPINVPSSNNGEYGQKKDIRAIVTQDLKPNYQDEFTLGFERSYTPDVNFGARFTYRKLGAGIDDTCDWRLLYDFALKNGIDVQNTNALGCQIYNPGRPLTVWVDGNDAAGNPVVTGKGQYATFSPEQVGQPKAKRDYAALDMFLEHPLRNGWYGRVNYTLSRSKGNMEGQTRSDTGQTDVGTSAAWDFPEFSVGANGLLPNDRKHALKAFGFYQVTPELTVGGNVLIQSGRPRLCYGTNNIVDAGEDPSWALGYEYGGPGYAYEYYYCGGKNSPRGSQGRLPWEKRLDLSATYAPALVKGLAVKVDVFNALNSQRSLAEESQYDEGDETIISPYYREVRYYQAPRSVRLTVEYNHKF